jgi:hypothetical protein
MDSDPRKTTLERTSSIYKSQTRPLVREGAPQKLDRDRVRKETDAYTERDSKKGVKEATSQK